MSALLSIGEAARRLNVSVDTVRELERRGELRASRTPGGHRRFKPAVLDAYLARRPLRARPNDNEMTNSTFDDSWEESDAVEGSSPLRVDHPVRSTGVTVSAEPPVSAAGQYLERARLEGLRAHGRAKIRIDASARARSAAIETLEAYVTSDRFPSSTPWWEAHPAIEAKVAAVLESFAAESARASAPTLPAPTSRTGRGPDDERVKALIAHGQSRALFATINWEGDDREEARADVLEALQEELESEWTEREVNDLVDEILDEWEEESED